MTKPFVLEPRDEFMHENTGEPNFNESMYFNFFDPGKRLGGFLRIGNRPNEGHAETTVCLYEPGGPVLFNFKRDPIDGNQGFEAGGTRFEVDEPFEALRIAYQGKACRLADPLQMASPRQAFEDNPFVPVDVALDISGVGPMFGGERSKPPREGSHELEFAKGHYEQHHRAVGRIEIDGERFAFDGFGLRDHSWGPRSWQAPLYYRWLTANFGADLGFCATFIVNRDGSEIRGGFVHRGSERILIKGVEIDTDFVGEQKVHDRIRARLECADGERLEVEGRVLSLIPLRNRRDGHTTRISEGMTEWRCAGRTGYGLSEYLDQLDN
jgi:hypothetical protein